MAQRNLPNHYQTNFEELGALDKEDSFQSLYKVRSTENKRFYAIKKIPFEDKDIEQTLEEIDLLSSLDSNYVVNYIDHWIEDNYYLDETEDRLKLNSPLINKDKKRLLHIQLEPCEMPLKYVIRILNKNVKKNYMSVQHFGLSCDILTQLLECINYIHKLEPVPIIHRNLTPDNIMLVNGENKRFVKLSDFGLSTYHEFVDQSHTKLTGTRQYLAPEVYTRKYDTKADIYSLGIIILELFNLDINSDDTFVDKHIKDKYDKLKSIGLNCLSIVTSKRPTCEMILKDLKHSKHYYSQNIDTIFNSIKQFVTEKYQILFDNDYEDYRKAIKDPVLLDEYRIALFSCFDRKKMIEDNFDRWGPLINNIDLLLNVVVDTYGDRLELQKEKVLEIHKEEIEKKKLFVLQNIMNVNDENDFQMLIQMLLHTGHDELAFKMFPPCIDMIDLKRCDPKKGFVRQFSFGLYNKFDSINRKYYETSISKDECYAMDKPIRGFCFLLVNVFTIGTYREIQRFRNIFYQLHFKVIMEKNLNADKLRDRLFKLSKSEELQNHDAFVYLSITHGTGNNVILGFDKKPIQINEIIEMFNNKHCPHLQNKPKMFFFNCCRGTNTDYGVPISRTLAQPIPTQNETITLPTKDDFIICYSTLDGFYAYFDWYKGTNFGQTLADVLVENVWSDDLYKILTKTQRLLKKKAEELHQNQPFEWTPSGVGKLIKFFPYKPSVRKLEERNN